jgi:hypothetical protein
LIDFSKIQYIRLTYTYLAGDGGTYFAAGHGGAGYNDPSHGNGVGYFTPDSTFTTFEQLSDRSDSKSIVIDVSNYNEKAYLKFELLTTNGAAYGSSTSATVTGIEYY